MAKNYKLNCFADDTGIEVNALGGAPGVCSARYAGPHKGAKDNIAKLLEALKNQKNRKARFRTVIVLIIDGKKSVFEGICKGKITEKPSGKSGFWVRSYF